MSKYKVVADEKEIFFRNLSAEEADRYYLALRNNNNTSIEEIIFKSILIDCDFDINELPAGIIPTIVSCAFKLSGYLSKEEDIPDKIEEARNEINRNFYFTVYSAIIRSQPGYTLDDLRKKSINELLELFALSEMILGQKVANVEEMRKLIKQGKTKNVPSAGGVESVTPEELELVKQMISAEEFNQELF